MALKHEGFETLEGQGFPTVRQTSIFLDNRIGQLLRLTKIFDVSDVRIFGLSVMDSVDCAVVRMLFDAPDKAIPILGKAGFAFSIAEVLVVELPAGKRGLLTVCSALLTSEINIGYTYPLLPTTTRPAIAISTDNIEIAVDTLQRHQFRVLGEADLESLP